MKPGWTAGVTRGAAAAQPHDRRRAGARRSPPADLWPRRCRRDRRQRIRRARAGRAEVVAAQRGVAETLLWHLRILAGWLPAAGAGLMRALAGWFELQNIDARLAALAG